MIKLYKLYIILSYINILYYILFIIIYARMNFSIRQHTCAE